jgi:hypothetical protein
MARDHLMTTRFSMSCGQWGLLSSCRKHSISADVQQHF